MAQRRFSKAWIVGASTGIGRGLALELAEQGVDVVASARGTDALAEVVSDGRALPGTIHPLPFDVTDYRCHAPRPPRRQRFLGEIELCVSCAGTYSPFGAQDFSAEKFRRIVDVNSHGHRQCSRSGDARDDCAPIRAYRRGVFGGRVSRPSCSVRVWRDEGRAHQYVRVTQVRPRSRQRQTAAR